MESSERTMSEPGILLLRAREAGAMLGISSRKLWEITNCGAIPCVRIGRAVRYDRRDIEAWIEEHKSRGPDVRHDFFS